MQQAASCSRSAPTSATAQRAAQRGTTTRCARRSVVGRQHLHSSARTSIVRRTSENWWEDEEEFDGVAGSLLLPKTLHVVSVPSAARRRSPGGGDEALVHVAAALVRTGPVDASHSSFAGGFCSSQVHELAQALWERLGQAGPPLFKKMRQRANLGAAGASAADEALGELLGQNWRVELDYGLPGANLEPREDLLVVAEASEAQALLSVLLDGQDVGWAPGLWQDVALINVDVKGWKSTSEALSHWRQLHPALSNVCSRQPA